jgi:hypothetical protein
MNCGGFVQSHVSGRYIILLRISGIHKAPGTEIVCIRSILRNDADILWQITGTEMVKVKMRDRQKVSAL